MRFIFKYSIAVFFGNYEKRIKTIRLKREEKGNFLHEENFIVQIT